MGRGARHSGSPEHRPPSRRFVAGRECPLPRSRPFPGAGDSLRTLTEVARGLVVLTRGAQGAQAKSRDGEEADVPAFPVSAVDTTAAGDAFVGALAVKLAEGAGVRESLIFASAAAAVSVTRLGAQPSLPSRGEVERFLAQGPAGPRALSGRGNLP